MKKLINPRPSFTTKADYPLRGKNSNCTLATVVAGEFKSETVGVMVEYQDGWCICDMGGETPMEIIHIDNLRLWVTVDGVEV